MQRANGALGAIFSVDGKIFLTFDDILTFGFILGDKKADKSL